MDHTSRAKELQGEEIDPVDSVKIILLVKMNINVARVYKVLCQLFLSIICYGDYERAANVPKYSFD